MYVSAEILTAIISVAMMLIAFASGLGWVVSHFSKQIDGLHGEIVGLDAKMERRFDRVDEKFDRVDERFERIDERFERIDERFERIDERFDRVDERFQGLERELTEVKISVARLEGPRPRLIEAH
jgi:chromosome segregation ATPase